MPRIVSVWLPRWPILRFLAAQAPVRRATPVDPERPFVLTVDASGGPRIAALNAAAESSGPRGRRRVADARAKAGGLCRCAPPILPPTMPRLRRLALWATRYTPAVSPWGEENGADGFFLDITGAAHLFGGEESLLADLARGSSASACRRGSPSPTRRARPGRCRAFILRRRRRCRPGSEAEALAPLADRGAAASPDTRTTLRRLGFKRIGALIDKPRAPFAARFEHELLHRLDQALGRAAEPLACIAPPPVYHSLRHLLEPIVTQEAIVAVATPADAATRAMRSCATAWARAALRLALYRVDGEVHDARHRPRRCRRAIPRISRSLVALKLERLRRDARCRLRLRDAGLAVTVAERMEPTADASSPPLADDADRRGALRRAHRQPAASGSARAACGSSQPVASHMPERAEAASRRATTRCRLADAGCDAAAARFSCCRAPSRPR